MRKGCSAASQHVLPGQPSPPPPTSGLSTVHGLLGQWCQPDADCLRGSSAGFWRTARLLWGSSGGFQRWPLAQVWFRCLPVGRCWARALGAFTPRCGLLQRIQGSLLPFGSFTAAPWAASRPAVPRAPSTLRLPPGPSPDPPARLRTSLRTRLPSPLSQSDSPCSPIRLAPPPSRPAAAQPPLLHSTCASPPLPIQARP